SPSAHRQLRSSTRSPARSRYSAATCSPSRPNSSLGFIGHHLHTDSARGESALAGRRRGLWMSWRDGGNCGKNRRNCPCRVLGCAGSCLAGPCLAGPCLAAPGRRRGAWRRLLGVGNLEVAPGEFLDVDVLERHDLDVLHEPGGPVHVPHPGVLHGDLEEHVTVLGRADVQFDLVSEVEPALGLDHVGEQAHDVPILPIELELHLGLVLFEIFRAHGLPSDQAMTGATAQMRSTIGQFSWPASLQAGSCSKPPSRSPTVSPPGSPHAACGSVSPQVTLLTFTNERRCSRHGPCVPSALMCAGVEYPLCRANPYSGYRRCRSRMMRSLVTLATTEAAATQAATSSPFHMARAGTPSPRTAQPS